MSADQPLIAVRDITKTFSHVTVLSQVSLEIYPAQILALLGENGAGKSTLMKIIAGIYQPDGGEHRS
jgi:ABC-type sugar transport system ATPase subunit